MVSPRERNGRPAARRRSAPAGPSPGLRSSNSYRRPSAGIRSSSATVNGRPAAGQASAMVTTLMVPLLHTASTLPGEWPGGIAPPGSRRTRREGLPSPGSHRPTLGARDEVPVDEEPGLTLTDSVQPGPGLLGPAAQSLVLLHGPPHQVLVDARCDGIQPGAVEGSVVADPASHLGIDVLGEARQVRGTAAGEGPGPKLPADRFCRLCGPGAV